MGAAHVQASDSIPSHSQIWPSPDIGRAELLPGKPPGKAGYCIQAEWQSNWFWLGDSSSWVGDKIHYDGYGSSWDEWIHN